MVLYPDADSRNGDWTKQTWDLPPYKSEDFLRYLHATGGTLEQFRKSQAYRFAVIRGLIVDDQWVGEQERILGY